MPGDSLPTHLASTGLSTQRYYQLRGWSLDGVPPATLGRVGLAAYLAGNE
jgi:hypothetical protein